MNGQSQRSDCSNRSSNFVVRINSNDNGTFQGNLENIQSGQIQNFRSLLEMCVLMQYKLDEHEFPRKAEEIRSWKDGADFDWTIGRKHDGN